MMADAVMARLDSTASSHIRGCLSVETRASRLARVSCVASACLRRQGLFRGGPGQVARERHSSLFLNWGLWTDDVHYGTQLRSHSDNIQAALKHHLPTWVKNSVIGTSVFSSLRTTNRCQEGLGFKPQNKKNKRKQRKRNAATATDEVGGIQATKVLNLDYVYSAPAEEAWTKGPFDLMAFLSKLQPLLGMGPSSLDPERSAAFVEECRGLMDDFLHGRFEGTFPETVLRSQLEKLARFFKTTPGLKDCPAGTWAPFKIHDERQSVSLSVLQLWVQVAELRSLTPPDPWSRAYREQLSHLAAAQSLVDYWVRMWDRTSNSGNCSERSSAEYGTLLENVSMVIDMADRQFVLNIANDMVAHLRSGEEAPSGTAKAASAVIETGIIACVKIENQDLALNAARAALNGGVTVLELTMTVPGALESVKTLVDEFPNAIIGVGTIYTAEEAAAAAQAGAHFVMSPIFNEEIVDVQKKLDVLYIPGAMTPTEIWTAHRSGCQIVKVFPASEATLRALRRPLASLQDPPLSLVASHGIRKEDVGRYLGDRLASAVVLSDAIFGHDRSADITAAARRVVAVAKAHKR